MLDGRAELEGGEDCPGSGVCGSGNECILRVEKGSFIAAGALYSATVAASTGAEDANREERRA
jgi:hypothetical protein